MSSKNDYSVEIIKESSEESSEVYSKGNSNSSSLPYFEEDKEMILLEDSPEKNTFLRYTSFYFLLYYSFWVLAIIFIYNFELKFLSFYLFYLFFFFVLLSFAIRIGFMIYKNVLRPYLFYFYIADLFLIFLTVISSKELVRDEEGFLYKYEYIVDYFIFFGIAGFLSILGYIVSTFINTKNELFNTFLGILFSNIFSALIFFLPNFFPKNNNLENYLNFVDLSLFFGFVFFYNIYLAFDLYLVLTRSAHKYDKNDYGMIYFLFWTDIYYRFWKNLIFRQKRMEKDHCEEPETKFDNTTELKI